MDQRPVALPKLYGAPAYGRPAFPMAPSPRPFDPDLLPLEAFQAEQEDRFDSLLPAHVYAPTGGDPHSDQANSGDDGAGGLRPRQFSLRSVAGRLFGGG